MKGNLITAAILMAASSFPVYADIPAPKATQPMDWTFVVTGVACAFVGGLLFVWLGRKFFKRSQ
jgi:protein-S-isoprenylcysteine O-methyltransferase Ste14